MVESCLKNRSCKWTAPALIAGLLLSLVQTGCVEQILTIGYLIGGPPTIEPEFDKATKTSLSDGKARVAVVCYAPNEVRLQYDSVDQHLGTMVSNRLAKNKVLVIDPGAIQAWIDKNGNDWDRPTEIGAALEADYVIYLEIGDFSLFEKDSSTLYRGRSTIEVTVHKMDGEDGDEIFTKTLESIYPTHTPTASQDVSFPDFRNNYMLRLSEQVGWLFYERANGDDIPYSVVY